MCSQMTSTHVFDNQFAFLSQDSHLSTTAFISSFRNGVPVLLVKHHIMFTYRKNRFRLIEGIGRYLQQVFLFNVQLVLRLLHGNRMGHPVGCTRKPLETLLVQSLNIREWPVIQDVILNHILHFTLAL